MQKIRIIAVILTMLLIFSACSGTSRAKCIIENEDGSYAIALPDSAELVELDEDYEAYLPYIRDALVQEAEQKLAQQLAQYSDSSNSGYYLTALDGCDGYLCLALEIIVDIPDAEGAGCGIDHEHIYLREPIVTEPLA